MFYKQQKFTSHSSRDWQSKTRVPAWLGEGPLWGCSLLTVPLLTMPWQKGQGVQLALFHKSIDFIRRICLPDIITSPQPHLLISSPWGSGTEFMNLEGHIQTTAPKKLKSATSYLQIGHQQYLMSLKKSRLSQSDVKSLGFQKRCLFSHTLKPLSGFLYYSDSLA